MTRSAFTEFEGFLLIRPCLYIRNWHHASEAQLRQLQELSWPFLLHGQDLQGAEAAFDIFEVLRSEEMEILSYEVEDPRHHLQWAFSACAQKEYTHIVVVDQWDDSAIRELRQLKDEILNNPWHVICFVSPKNSKVAEQSWRSRLPSMETYLPKKPGVCVFPVFFVQCLELQARKKGSLLEVLDHLRGRGIAFRELAIQGLPAQDGDELKSDPDVAAMVERRWAEYGLGDLDMGEADPNLFGYDIR
ncbi:MAG: hypothetical protein AAF203_03570 [Pseudomonadota bacterium]